MLQWLVTFLYLCKLASWFIVHGSVSMFVIVQVIFDVDWSLICVRGNVQKLASINLPRYSSGVNKKKYYRPGKAHIISK